ncbi:hypothetical protein [Lentzea flaviverrucosa]|uniref:Uncharacterized protein n=1 Tax=Lentzea flaviverrucosa TaxID=200379 RepID=A0A1H9MVI7_9PSEU|nr:hypothetical protein [Lentzea flaviverrucosa]RDI30769.1 hypothetical protein DFR72_104101 [Lentzea flaviverrucosa]SER27537.1 hypothetical protein SAMN05216195_104526 [Lentzea flaviverrucosa]
MKKFTAGKTAAVVAVAGGAILASIAPVMADVSAQSPSQALVRVESPAKRKASGAAVEADVTFSCPAGVQQGYINLSITQRVPFGVASGSTSKSVTCTGAFQTVKVSVTAQNRAFLGGRAYAKAELSAWPHSATHEGEIQIDW